MPAASSGIFGVAALAMVRPGNHGPPMQARSRMAYHVSPVGSYWKVSLPGDSIPASFHAEKDDALAYALSLAREDPAANSVLVLTPEGRVEREYAPEERSRRVG